MRTLFVFVFSFMLIFSSSCAMKKLVIHQFGTQENIPTKTSPFSKDDSFSLASEACIFGTKAVIFTDDFSAFVHLAKKQKISGPLSVLSHFSKTGVLFPPFLFFRTKKYSFSTTSTPLYLKFGRIIYYA